MNAITNNGSTSPKQATILSEISDGKENVFGRALKTRSKFEWRDVGGGKPFQILALATGHF